MQRGSFMQCVSIAFLLLTLRSITASGTASAVHYLMCMACFAVAMRGASLIAGPLTAIGDERKFMWYVITKLALSRFTDRATHAALPRRVLFPGARAGRRKNWRDAPTLRCLTTAECT